MGLGETQLAKKETGDEGVEEARSMTNGEFQKRCSGVASLGFGLCHSIDIRHSSLWTSPSSRSGSSPRDLPTEIKVR